MAINWIEAGGDSTYDISLWSGVNFNSGSSNPPVVDTGVSYTGPCSIRSNILATGNPSNVYRSGCLGDTGRRLSFRIRFAGLPSSTAAEFVGLSNFSGTTIAGLRIRSDGKIQFGSSASVGSSVLSTNTWYRITLAYTITSTSVNSFKVFLNGNLELSVTNAILPNTNAITLCMGWSSSGALPPANTSCWIDDIYLDDSNALTDPGDIQVTAKLPSALSTNTFGGTIGGPFSNRWDYVDRRPSSLSDYLYVTAYPQTEIFGIQSASTGDVSLASAAIVGYAGWVTAYLPSGGINSKLTLNGTDFGVSPSGADPTIYYQTVVSGSYPSNAAGIGVKYTDTTGIPKLYECGVIVAYTAVAGPPAAPTGLAASPGNTQISLSWSASSGATTYNIKRSTTSGSGYVTVTSGVSTTSATDTGLTNGTTYYYVVSAVNVSGESANSTQASATPIAAPSAPTGVTASPGNTQVSLAWSAVSGASTYNVKRSTTSGSGYSTIATVSLTSTTDAFVTNGTTYYYVITAINAGGESGNSSQVSATPIVPPNVVWMESGGDATYDFQFWNTTTGSPVVDTTISNTGPASLKFDSTVSNTQVNTSRSLAADTGRRISFYARFSSLPTSVADFFTIKTSGFVYIMGVGLRSDGKLQLGGDATAVGTTTLSTSIQYRVCFSYTISSTTVNSFRVYLNGNLEISKNNVTLPSTGSVNMSWGWPNAGALPGASKIAWIDDIFVDDSNSLTDTGDVRITAKQPNTLSTNTFAFVFGNSYANRWQYVSERPRSNLSGIQSSGSPQTEIFGIQNASTGDVNVSGAVYKGYMGWVTALYTGTLPTTYLTINGSDVLFNLNTGSTTFSVLSTSTAYPSNSAGIGIKQTAGTGGVQFFEGGILVAFSGGTVQTVNLVTTSVATGSQAVTLSTTMTRNLTNQSRSLVAQSVVGQNGLTRLVLTQTRNLAAQTVTRQATLTRNVTNQSRSLVAQATSGQNNLTRSVSTQAQTLTPQTFAKQAVLTRNVTSQTRALTTPIALVVTPQIKSLSAQIRPLSATTVVNQMLFTKSLGALSRPLTANTASLQAGVMVRNLSSQSRSLSAQTVTRQLGLVTVLPSARVVAASLRTPVIQTAALTVSVLRNLLPVAVQTAGLSGQATIRGVSASILAAVARTLAVQVGVISKSVTAQSRSLAAATLILQSTFNRGVSAETLTIASQSISGAFSNTKNLLVQSRTLSALVCGSIIGNLARPSSVSGILTTRSLSIQKGTATTQLLAVSRSLTNHTPTFQMGRITKTLLTQTRTLSAAAEAVVRGEIIRAPTAQIRTLSVQTPQWGMGIHVSGVITLSPQARSVSLTTFRRMSLAACFMQGSSTHPTILRTIPYLLTGVNLQANSRIATVVPGGITKALLSQTRPLTATVALSHPAGVTHSTGGVSVSSSASLLTPLPGGVFGRPSPATTSLQALALSGFGGAVSCDLDFQAMATQIPEVPIAHSSYLIGAAFTEEITILGVVQVGGSRLFALTNPARGLLTVPITTQHSTYRLATQILRGSLPILQANSTNILSDVGLGLVILLPSPTLSLFGYYHARVSDRLYGIILPSGGESSGAILEVPLPKGTVFPDNYS